MPPWMRGRGTGWVTSEYGMLPGSTGERKQRDATRGKQDGRTVEIQRLVGRSLRSVVDFARARRAHGVDRLRRDPGRRRHPLRRDLRRLRRHRERVPAPGRERVAPADAAHRRGRGHLGRDRRRRAAARPALRRGQPGRGRHERRHDRVGRADRGAGDGREDAVRAGVARPACSSWPPAASPRSCASRSGCSPGRREDRPRLGQRPQGPGARAAARGLGRRDVSRAACRRRPARRSSRTRG